MDDIERKAVYDAAFRLISGPMMQLYGQWSGMGSELTAGEEDEINKELANLQNKAGRAAVIAKESMVAMRDRMTLSAANDIANEHGFTLVLTESLEEDEDDDDSEGETSNE